MARARRPERDFSVPEAQPFLLEGGEHGVLLIHGFTGSAAHMRPLGELLHAQGFTVQGINLPGHAKRPEAMLFTDWQAWLNAAREACTTLKQRCRYVSAAGLSMGGVLTLLLAEENGLTAAVPISAPMGSKKAPLSMAPLIAPFMPMTWWSADGERQKQLDQRYDLGYPCFPTRCAGDLARLIRLARQDLGQVTCPVLAVQSRADETIIPESARIIMQGIHSEQKGTLWLEEAPHTCTVSRACPQMAQEIGSFLRNSEKCDNSHNISKKITTK